MKLYYTDEFVLPLPEGHRFPMGKYSALRQRLLEAGMCPPHTMHVPAAASDAELLRVHTSEYVSAVVNGALSAAAIRRIGFPWSAAMVERSRRSVGATLAAARAAIEDRVAVNLAGGTHHAFADRGEGFCFFNDVAVAVHALRAEHVISRAAILDTDVHQGNGTAAIFENEPAIFTFSVHGENNFPFHKTPGSLDIGLADGAGDDEWLSAIATGLESIRAHAPDIVFYIAGADPWSGDRLGRLEVSKDALAVRDTTVFHYAESAGVPVVVVMGGGYAADVSDIVDIHARTVFTAGEFALRSATATSR
jgi:acetoin utilization deacetylase AcuC-like enzyme